MALVDDAVNILKWSGKTALWGLGVVVGLRVLIPVLLPYCKPLAKEAVRGCAALRARLQPGEGVLPRPEETVGKVMAVPKVAPAVRSKPHVLPPVKKKTAEAAAKTKIAKLRPYQQWSKAELYQRAKDLDIPGRSAMSKVELIKAIRAAGK